MNKFLFIFLFLLLAVACGDKKPKEQPTSDDSTAVQMEEDDTESDSVASLSYTGSGFSTFKRESMARKQATLRGRRDIMKNLSEDAKQLVAVFVKGHADLFSDAADAESLATEVSQALSKSVSLTGSQVSEFEYSDGEDTLFAVVEMPLQNGCEAILEAMLEIAVKNSWLNAEAGKIKSAFREFFKVEKKIGLTTPS